MTTHEIAKQLTNNVDLRNIACLAFIGGIVFIYGIFIAMTEWRFHHVKSDYFTLILSIFMPLVVGAGLILFCVMTAIQNVPINDVQDRMIIVGTGTVSPSDDGKYLRIKSTDGSGFKVHVSGNLRGVKKTKTITSLKVKPNDRLKNIKTDNRLIKFKANGYGKVLKAEMVEK
ncbi:hypothetical protein JOC36_001502 [Weissella uvarum]|uniref:hypothetical protein n=1 Tax=Weissella uvarum TaxID=1479233 RepID=UPI001960602B|nr:hypothetical protein [Weissella uvarum]MBM7617909.1 hypothetical protein [Weissella uvarum]MCM0596094.1 hypothetical protein [Weissella uvarum]